MVTRSYVYIKTNEKNRGIERVFTPVDPGDGWRKLSREENDMTKTRYQSFRYLPDGTIIKIPEVKIIVSGSSVEEGKEFSVRVEPVDDLGDKTTVGINISGTHYDVELTEEMILIEGEEGVYTIMLDDDDVWTEKEIHTVMVIPMDIDT